MNRSKFIEYAIEIQNYTDFLSRMTNEAGVEYFESEFAAPLDAMEKIVFDQFDNEFDDSVSEEFWHLALMEETNEDDWADFYDKLIKE